MNQPESPMDDIAAGPLCRDPVAYQAGVRPDALALVELARGQRLTYRALDSRVAAVAARLAGQAGERIAWLGRNCLDAVVLAQACQRAGAVFVPLNWRLTGPELAALTADCAPRLLVHDPEFATAAGATSVALCERGAPLPFPAGEARTPPDPAAPWTLLYTSGTTGQPKGAVVTVAGALFSALNFAFVSELASGSVILSDAPMFHTVGLVATMRTALTLGATLVVSDRFVPEATLRAIGDPALGITHYFGVPQIAVALRRHALFPATDISRLRGLFVGGAPVSPALIAEFRAAGIKLVNGFGMTETGTVTGMPLDSAAIAARPGSVGLAAPFVRIRLVGLDGLHVADGAVGEVWLRGPAVTPGYWNNPAATAAAFADGWFRTGDLARRDDGGCYWIVDRLKDLFISGGENVYPAEVENVLFAMPGVADVAVLGLPHPLWGEAGVAFVVPRDGAAIGEAEVRQFCAGRLARYKHPAAVRIVDAIPRTASGKIQRHKLRGIADAGMFGDSAP